MVVSDPLVNALSPDTQWVVCLRPFDATGHQLMRGEVISTIGWPGHRIAVLIERRYLTPLPAGIAVPEETRIEGVNRRIVDITAALEVTSRPTPVEKPTPTRETSKPTPQKAAVKKPATKAAKKKQ